MISLSHLNKVLVLIACITFSLLYPNLSEAKNSNTIALVMKSLSNPFFFKMEVGAREYAKDENIPLEVFGLENETETARQISIVEDLISRNYGAIVIAPADSIKLVKICKKAMEKGIVVINIDNPFHKETMVQLGVSIPFVGSDNYAGAQMVGNYIKRKLKGHGRVLVIEGIRGVENADLRKKGFIESVTDNSQIEIVASESANWHTEEALALTVNLLNTNKNIDAIFCANDSMALGAMQAIDLLGMSQKIIVAGYDNIESVHTEIRNARIKATIEQHPELMGKYGVKLAFNQLKGIKPPLYKSTPLDLITYETFNKKVGFLISTLQNSFFSVLLEGAQEAADLFGIELIPFDAKNEDARQLTQMSMALSQEFDLLVLNATDSESISTGIELSNNAGIPVITVDRKVSDGKVLCHIESDNVQGCRIAADMMVQHLGGKGKILELEGIPGTSAAYERGSGFNEEIRKFSKINVAFREVADFDRQEAKSVMLRYIRKNIFFDGVFAHNDHMILGVVDAYESSEMKFPRVLIGFDAIPEAKKLIMAKKLTCTIAQKPKIMGKMAIEIAARYFRGENIPPKQTVELTLIEQEKE